MGDIVIADRLVQVLTEAVINRTQRIHRTDGFGRGAEIFAFRPGVVEIELKAVTESFAQGDMHPVIVASSNGAEGVKSGVLGVPHGVRAQLAARGSAVDVDVQKGGCPIPARGQVLRVDALRSRESVAGGSGPHVLPI